MTPSVQMRVWTYQHVHIPEITDVAGKVSCPHPLHKVIALLQKHFHWSMAIRTMEIPDLTFTRAVTIHVLILLCVDESGITQYGSTVYIWMALVWPAL